MSLSALKAKTKQKCCISKDGIFSLNGGIRNLSYVGKTYKNSVNNNKPPPTNNPYVIKRSTMNTNGLFLENNSNKNIAKDESHKNQTQSTYIEKKKEIEECICK